MFNLIVSGRLDGKRHGKIESDRVFEFTDEDIRNRFTVEGKVDTASLMSLPTIFMGEGVEDEIVSIGWLSRVEMRERLIPLLPVPSAYRRSSVIGERKTPAISRNS